jgi:alanyl-tRNA synthetase
MYLNFFKEKGHAVIGSASVIPSNDPTVLFTTAGMHPLVPYLMGQAHPAGRRLANVQKCIRTGDIDEVGDDTHCTFFEMLGNWSLGDYFKEEAIAFSFEFLTSEKYLNIPLKNLSVSVFAGDRDAPRDEASAKIWRERGLPESRIFYLPKANNWWGPAGITGPCGPDTEMFFTKNKPCGPDCSPACDCGNYIEIWNDVFMEYFKTAGGKYDKLSQKNVDTGMGLERVLCTINNLKSVYDTDVFSAALKEIEKCSGLKYKDASGETKKSFRIIADHVRTATMILGDRNGITPSNVDQGYILRRLIRRAVRFGRNINLQSGSLSKIALCFVKVYKDIYPELLTNQEKITAELDKEEQKFSAALSTGLKEFDKITGRLAAQNIGVIGGKTAFRLYDTFGFPIELTVELSKERGFNVDTAGFAECFAAHQELSKAGAEQKFKGGLSDASEATARLHTATHILLAVLKRFYGSETVNQRGSNITAERLRFDFSFPRKLEAGELKKIEEEVNKIISENLEVTVNEMPLDEAKRLGATGIFDDKYESKVKVYKIGGASLEICGGPHAANTRELGRFVIQKEESSSAGVRRIKAVLE